VDDDILSMPDGDKVRQIVALAGNRHGAILPERQQLTDI